MLFCGDGINDLSALSKADVGYAVGASEASIAASLYTAKNSVAGAGTDDVACTNAHSIETALTGLYDKLVGLTRGCHCMLQEILKFASC